MGVAAAAAAAGILAAQTADILKQGSRDAASIETAPDKTEEIATEASESTAEERPPRRLGAYAHVPESAPFSAKPSEKEIAAIEAQQLPYGIAPIKQERSIVKSTFQNPGTKTLELLIESANGEMNLDTGFSLDVVMNNTVSGFFSFYAEVSEAPIESFQQLIFTPTWENCSGARATKVMGESLWKKLKKVLQTGYEQAQKNEPGEMEFQIMVQMG
ncbi:hypothetical protein DL95DRAFT_414514 [Leptodontidium sp. 2 PMI_412]|nr:hypothetical protein DL95DRAFT_414514 [Leptodontidium sp. 2 PMI_412]